VIVDPAGNLFRTLQRGGNGYNDGAVYKLNASGKETVLHDFSGGADGAVPYAPLIEVAGTLYGTTSQGGTSNSGTVFKVTKRRGSVLHTFVGMPNDGASPQAPLILDSAGNLYGTAYLGGTCDRGVIFKLDQTGNETVLHNFMVGAADDGANPYAGAISDSVGNLCGTTYYGGTANLGVVFKLDTTTGIETVLHSFTGEKDGENPATGVVLDSEGNLYGSTSYGGTQGWGVLYEITVASDELILHEFLNEADGARPNGLIYSEGFLYGTTALGGTLEDGNPGYGVIFRFKPQK
jgi:uncharacterized repeat protein (TIGR03803 family)